MLILTILIKYKDVLFDELLEEYLDWLDEEWFRIEDGENKALKVLIEMFPHPYHV